jgi:L-ectoine synthase
MKVRRLEDFAGTDREVQADTWVSRRFILADDRVGFSFNDTILYAGTTTKMWYRNHVESVYCIDGEGEILDVATGEVHRITPGTMYLLDNHDRHELTAITDLRMMCVFTPALTGHETHDPDGAYPLLSPDPDATIEATSTA